MSCVIKGEECPLCGKALKSSWDFDAEGKQVPMVLCVGFGGSCGYKRRPRCSKCNDRRVVDGDMDIGDIMIPDVPCPACGDACNPPRDEVKEKPEVPDLFAGRRNHFNRAVTKLVALAGNQSSQHRAQDQKDALVTVTQHVDLLESSLIRVKELCREPLGEEECANHVFGVRCPNCAGTGVRDVVDGMPDVVEVVRHVVDELKEAWARDDERIKWQKAAEERRDLLQKKIDVLNKRVVCHPECCRAHSTSDDDMVEHFDLEECDCGLNELASPEDRITKSGVEKVETPGTKMKVVAAASWRVSVEGTDDQGDLLYAAFRCSGVPADGIEWMMGPGQLKIEAFMTDIQLENFQSWRREYEEKK